MIFQSFKYIVLFISSLFFFNLYVYANNNYTYTFIENKGQWQSNVLFKTDLVSGNLFLEKNCFTFSFYDNSILAKLHYHPESIAFEDDPKIKYHAVKMNFINALPDVKVKSQFPVSEYYNYYIGNHPSKWASYVNAYTFVEYQNVYSKINMQLYTYNKHLKYDFIVNKGGNPSDIQIKVEGTDEVYLEGENLIIRTTLGELIQQKPFAYQYNSREDDVSKTMNDKHEIQCRYSLSSDKIITFVFPDGYDKSKTLVIDPVLIGSTYTGASSDNWGMTATYDNAGNMYSGGVAFGQGYPVSTGAYDVSFFSGVQVTDAAIIKYDSTGSNRIYATFLGGQSSETVQSMVVNSKNELCIYGVTGSPDFPTSVNAYDNSFNGGTNIKFLSIETYTSGTDIYVAKFNLSGTSLLSSTFVGGTANDGVNYNLTYSMGEPKYDSLQHNYGDQYRGEIIVDDSSNMYIATSTRSTDFPIVNGFQDTLSGQQEGIVMKFDSSLSNLIWSTYIGGSDKDAAFSLKLDTANNVYVAGGTTSSDFPVTSGALDTLYKGGIADGYVAKIGKNGDTLLASSFIGTNKYDQSYFIEIDNESNIYIVGQTLGNYTVTSGVYSNPNSPQFITKLTPALDSVMLSTVFGIADSVTNISPTAFLVDKCGHIYVSGWGGKSGMSVTADAYRSTFSSGMFDGSDFYLFVLDKDASSLMYASFFGGTSSRDHVDGGTSRFDKEGIIYQSVCASCGGSSTDFPTTPTAWSKTDSSSNCNNAVFKFDFQLARIMAEAKAAPASIGCKPFTVNFQNLSTSATSQLWNFGDGSPTDTTFEPVHTYDSAGVYDVILIINNPKSCNTYDTAYLKITVNTGYYINADFTTNTVNKCDSLLITTNNSSKGSSKYKWNFGDGSPFSNVFQPTHTFLDTGTFNIQLIVTDSGSCNVADTTSQVVSFGAGYNVKSNFLTNIYTSCDTLLVNTSNISTGGSGKTYQWNFGDGTPVNTSLQPVHYYSDTGKYIIQLITSDTGSCNLSDTSKITLTLNRLDSVHADFTINKTDGCDSTQISTVNNSSSGASFQWNFGDGSPVYVTSAPVHFYTNAGDYKIVLIATDSNTCNLTDTDSTTLSILLRDTLFAAFTVDVDSSCGITKVTTNNISKGSVLSYFWDFQNATYNSQNAIHTYTSNGTYTITLTVEDTLCKVQDTATAIVNVLFDFILKADFTYKENLWCKKVSNYEFTYTGEGEDSLFWQMGDGTLKYNDTFFTYRYATSGTYQVILTVIDNDCGFTDTISKTLTFERSNDSLTVAVPNVFTPNNDGENDMFKLYYAEQPNTNLYTDFESYTLKIFNRWGTLVSDEKPYWDGKINGKEAPSGVYFWLMKYKRCEDTEEQEEHGTVTLLY